MSEAARLLIHIDGAARGNPGPAAFAYVIAREGHPVVEHAECMGETTNNVAEYTALVRALERAGELGGQHVLVKSDSELLVKQMNGVYQVKNEQLRILYSRARKLREQFASLSIQHVPRSQNSHADRLCNEALDDLRGVGCDRLARSSPSKRGSKKATAWDAARAEAVQCLQNAAGAWSRGSAGVLSAEQVWEQLWSIFEENGLV